MEGPAKARRVQLCILKNTGLKKTDGDTICLNPKKRPGTGYSSGYSVPGFFFAARLRAKGEVTAGAPAFCGMHREWMESLC